MASDLENALKNVAQKIVKYVEDASTLTVETRYVEIGDDKTADFAQARPVARTVIHLDADNDGILPVRRGQNGLEVDSDLYELHQKNVETAIEYRTKILTSLLSAIQRRT